MNSPTVDRLVRPMETEDLAEVLRIDRLSFPTPWPERTYRYELDENLSAHLFVAEIEEGGRRRVVGYVGYWVIVDEMHISTLAVDPEYRRRGIGEQLLRAALDHAVDQGAGLATLEVRVSNGAAVELYRKHAFEVVGRRPRYYRDNGEDAFLMTRRGLTGRGEP